MRTRTSGAVGPAPWDRRFQSPFPFAVSIRPFQSPFPFALPFAFFERALNASRRGTKINAPQPQSGTPYVPPSPAYALARHTRRTCPSHHGADRAAQQRPGRAFTIDDALNVRSSRIEDVSKDGRWVALTVRVRRDALGVDNARYGDPTYVAPSLANSS